MQVVLVAARVVERAMDLAESSRRGSRHCATVRFQRQFGRPGATFKGRQQVDLQARPALLTRRLADYRLETAASNPSGRASLRAVVGELLGRWLTVATSIELALIVFLVGGCFYQCYLIIDDYYHYPTHISVTRTINDDFRTDLPSLTLCNKNRLSLASIRANYPNLNDSHYKAISYGHFESVDKFSVQQDNSNSSLPVNWNRVANWMSNNTIAGSSRHLPAYSIVQQVFCANVWGDNVPCRKLEQLANVQDGLECVTLFHDSIFWDRSCKAVRELEAALARYPAKIEYGKRIASLPSEAIASLESIDESEAEEMLSNIEENARDNYPKVKMNNFEILRIRVDFRQSDYAMKEGVSPGALVTITPNNFIGSRRHLAYEIAPGHWYNYYIERFDFLRLPAPYKTNCHDYEQNRYNFRSRRAAEVGMRERLAELRKQQVSQPDQLIGEYAQSLRDTSLGSVSSQRRA